MKIKIEFAERTGRSALKIEAENIKSAVEKLLIKGANLDGANLEEANLRGANLLGAGLRESNLRGADLLGADLRGADLLGANLDKADLEGANLLGANLLGAGLRESNLLGVNLRGANLERANLLGANLDKADLEGANLDYACWPLFCRSLNVRIDKRQAVQLLYHTLRAMQSVDDPEILEILADPKILNLANQFHRVSECGKIEGVKTEKMSESMRRGELTEFQSTMAEAASVVDCVRSDMEAVKAKLVEEVTVLPRSGAEFEFVNGRFQAVKFVIACLEAAGEKLKNVK